METIQAKLFNKLFKYKNMINQLSDLQMIIDPESITPNIETFYGKLRTNIPPQTKSYYKGKMEKLIESADHLLLNMNKADEEFFGFTKKEIEKELMKAKIKYLNAYYPYN